MKLRVRLEGQPGMTIEEAIEQAVDIADQLQLTVILYFNETPVYADPAKPLPGWAVLGGGVEYAHRNERIAQTRRDYESLTATSFGKGAR